MRTIASLALLLGLIGTACGGDLSSGDLSSDDLNCEEKIDQSRDEIAATINENLSCLSNDDCTTVNIATDCEGRCAVAVAKVGLEVVQDAVSNASGVYCDDFSSSCHYRHPMCTTDKVPICDGNNQCVLGSQSATPVGNP